MHGGKGHAQELADVDTHCVRKNDPHVEREDARMGARVVGTGGQTRPPRTRHCTEVLRGRKEGVEPHVGWARGDVTHVAEVTVRRERSRARCGTE